MLPDRCKRVVGRTGDLRRYLKAFHNRSDRQVGPLLSNFDAFYVSFQKIPSRRPLASQEAALYLYGALQKGYLLGGKIYQFSKPGPWTGTDSGLHCIIRQGKEYLREAAMVNELNVFLGESDPR